MEEALCLRPRRDLPPLSLPGPPRLELLLRVRRRVSLTGDMDRDFLRGRRAPAGDTLRLRLSRADFRCERLRERERERRSEPEDESDLSRLLLRSGERLRDEEYRRRFGAGESRPDEGDLLRGRGR